MKHLKEINHGGYPKDTFAKGLWLSYYSDSQASFV